MFNFTIDSREQNKDLFLFFDLYSQEKKFKYEKKLIEVGDVICGNICIERKEAHDFIGSIMDGRLKEQAIKMYMNYKYKYVIIEGNPFRTNSNINHNAIIGKMASLMVTYDIKIIMVDSTKQFVYACYSIVSKHAEKNEFDPIDFDKVINKIRNEEIPTAMLIQIPGVGKDKASKISEFYGNDIRRIFSEIKFDDLITIDGIGEVLANKIINQIDYKKNKK